MAFSDKHVKRIHNFEEQILRQQIPDLQTIEFWNNMLFGLYSRSNMDDMRLMNKIDYTQMVNLNMSKRGLNQWAKDFGGKSTTCSVPALSCQNLSLDKRMGVGHVGGGVGEVDPIGQVPLLLLLLGSPAVESWFLILRRIGNRKLLVESLNYIRSR